MSRPIAWCMSLIFGALFGISWCQDVKRAARPASITIFRGAAMNLRALFRRRPGRGLTYAATARCPCGAGLAYLGGDDCWDCSAILRGDAIPSGEPGAVKHTARLPFVFYEIKSENQPSARGATTRPTA